MVTPLRQTLVCPIMVGRSAHLDALHAALQRASTGSGQTVLLAGEAGIGKTRLVTEARLRAAHSGLALLEGNCFGPDRSLAFGPLLDLLRVYAAGADSTELLAVLDSAAPEVLKLLPELAGRLPGIVPSAPLETEQEKRRLFEALVQVFARLAAHCPLLVIVEDVHWADDASLEFLLLLARRAPTLPILLLLTYRSDEVHPGLRRFLADLNRGRLATEWPLEPLDEAGVEAMLRATFDLERPVRRAFLDALYALTEGNPFFVEESLKALVVAGDIFYSGGRWDRKATSELHIPCSVQDAVERRTTQLSAEARDVLILAAVAGQRFDFALLQHLTGREEGDLLRLIKELIAAQLVVEVSEETFLFRHALTRQAVSAQLLARERKALHQAILEAQERLYADHLDIHLHELAYHAHAAGMWRQAHSYSRQVADHALSVYAPAAAVEHFTRALEAAQQLALAADPLLLRGRGKAYETLGDFERAERDYQDALVAARTLGDRRAEWQGLIDLGFLWTARDYARTGNFLRATLECAQTLEDDALRAHTLNRLGNWHLNVEQPVEALRYHHEALDIFVEAADQPALAETFDLLGMANYLRGDLMESQRSCEQAVAIFRALDDRRGLVSSLPTLMLCSGNYFTETMVPGPKSLAETLLFGEEALKTAHEIGQRSDEAYILLTLGVCLGPRGEYARALDLAQRALAIAEEIEHRQWMSAIHWGLGRLYLDLLAVPVARRHLEQALELARELGSEFWTRAAAGLLAWACVLLHDPAQAEAILSTALESAAPVETMGQRLVWYARAELALATGDSGRALEITNQLIASAKNVTAERTIPLLYKLQGEALTVLRQPAAAEVALRAAQLSATAQRSRPLQWRIAVALGTLYRAERRDDEAARAFADAHETIDHVAAQLPDSSLRHDFLQQADAHISGVQQLTPRRAARRAPGGLTERECEVAEQIARGKSNREIAEQLTVTERTVETHVRNILTKLDLASRTQIAVWAITQGVIKNVH